MIIIIRQKLSNLVLFNV